MQWKRIRKYENKDKITNDSVRMLYFDDPARCYINKFTCFESIVHFKSIIYS